MSQLSSDRAPSYNMAFLWVICPVAAMGGLLFGYDWVVIGGAKPFYEPFFEISDKPFLQGWAMSSALVGCLVGAVISGMLSDKFGRKRLLITAGFLFTLSAVGTALAWDFIWFNTFRWIGGVGIGLASNLSPMYIAEISPAETRGRFVSINQLTIVIGILAAQIINWMIADRVPTVDQLRLLASSDAQVRAVYGDEYDVLFQAARARADAVTDSAAFARIRAEFPTFAVQEPSTEEQKKAKADEDQEVLDSYLRLTWNGRFGWRWMFAAETVPAWLFFLLMFFVPESPRWLVKYGRNEQAERILARVGGEEYARFEVQDIKDTLASEEIAQVHFSDLLEPKLLKIVGLGVFLAVFQQWCGINVIFNYAQEVFKAAGYGVDAIMFTIVVTGIVNLAFTFVAIFTVDKFGRRPLMLIGAGGLAGIYAVLGIGYWSQSTGIHMLILVVSAIACYAMSLAPVTWVVISEIFPNRIRGAAMSVAVFSLWVGCTALTFTFPILNKGFTIGEGEDAWIWAGLGAHGAFWLYGAICVVGFLVILRKLPETKGKSLEDIERELVD
jgi:MFS family permease